MDYGSDGELAPGVHALDDQMLYEEFVENAPHTAVRQRLHTSMRLHLDILKDIAGGGTVIIGGGFVSHKAAPPNDVDLVYLCRDSDHLESVMLHPDVLPLLTLQSGYFTYPAMLAFQRLQPVGGKVDAFLATPRAYPYWREMWSTVKGTGRSGAKRGYVEVTI